MRKRDFSNTPLRRGARLTYSVGSVIQLQLPRIDQILVATNGHTQLTALLCFELPTPVSRHGRQPGLAILHPQLRLTARVVMALGLGARRRFHSGKRWDIKRVSFHDYAQFQKTESERCSLSYYQDPLEKIQKSFSTEVSVPVRCVGAV
jgi:hypothetical protein